MKPPGIFLSYRREETAGYARVLYDRLTTRFAGQIFMDVNSINAGVDFGAAIERAVSESRVLIALIGKQWDTVTTEAGKRRLDDPKDFVRLEITAALNKGLLVVPTLVPGASLPGPDHLPEALVGLTRRQAIQLTDADFDNDILRLISVIEQALGPPKIYRLRRLRLSTAFAAAIMIVLGVAVAGYFLRSFRATVRPPSPPPTIAPGTTKSAVPVTAHGMLSNDGWMISFNLPDEHIRQIFYKFDTDKQYMSTGVSHARADSVTGLPVPNMSIVVPGLTSPHIIDIKYADSEGKEHGPFHVAFDPQHEMVTETKDILDSIAGWVSFREYPAGRMIVYFTMLVSYKNAFREIRYSLDNESVSQRLKFKPDWSSRGSPGIGPEDEIYLNIPMSTKYVCVKLFYIDGTESPIKKFEVAELGLSH